MRVETSTSFGRLVGMLGAAAAIMTMLAVVDGLTQEYRGEFNRFQGLTGQAIPLTGPMPEYASSLDVLRVTGGEDAVSLTMDGEATGMWLGGRMWRGTAHISPLASPGEYILKVRTATELAQNPRLVYRILVYDNQQALIHDSTSLLRRWFGLMPKDVAICSAILTALSFGATYLLTTAKERAQAAQGLAEIYVAKSSESGTEIRFGLGENQGLLVGDHVTIVDSYGKNLGTATVVHVDAEDSTARGDPHITIRAGDSVRFMNLRTPQGMDSRNK